MINKLYELIEMIKTNINKPLALAYANAGKTNLAEKKSYISYFWQPSMENRKEDTKKETNCTKVIKREDKLQVVLNNLKQKLEYSQEILEEVDMAINLIAQEKDSTMQESDNVMALILKEIELYLIQKEKIVNEKYIEKIEKTIKYCVKNYDLYISSDYYATYHKDNSCEK